MPLDKQRIIEQAQRTLARREQALNTTLEEIALLEAAGAPPQAIQMARTKRHRQQNACLAATALINALTTKKTK